MLSLTGLTLPLMTSFPVKTRRAAQSVTQPCLTSPPPARDTAEGPIPTPAAHLRSQLGTKTKQSLGHHQVSPNNMPKVTQHSPSLAMVAVSVTAGVTGTRQEIRVRDRCQKQSAAPLSPRQEC